MAARQAVLGMEQASFFYGSSRVFENVSFLLDDARTALVGENGAGKSTLLKCLAGELELNARPGDPLARPARRHRAAGRARRPGRPDRARGAGALAGARSARATTGGASTCCSTRSASRRRSLDKPFGALSGGWQRLMLIAAAARLEEPDILILDEPTNHLDLANINTLERWLTEEFKLPMLIVSHDREFLDRVTERTLFLRADGVHAFKTALLASRARSCCAATPRPPPARELEEKEIKRLEQAAARYKVWAVKNPDLNKRKNAVETPHRPHRGRTHPDLCRARAAAGTGRRRHRRQGGAAAGRPRRQDAGRARKLITHRPARHRRRRPRRAAGRQRRRQVDAAVGAGRRLRSRAASTTTARRRCASIRPAGWSISTRRCATCR